MAKSEQKQKNQMEQTSPDREPKPAEEQKTAPAAETVEDANNQEDAQVAKQPEEQSKSQESITAPTTESAATLSAETAEAADSAKAAEQQPQTPPPVTEPSASAPTAAEVKQKLSKTALFALLLALVALGASGWLFYQSLLLQQKNADLAREMQQISNNSQQLAGTAREQVGAVRGQIEQLERQQRQERQSIEEVQKRLTLTAQQISQQSGATRTDWLLAEVEYLLRLANQRILMERTAVGALNLLTSADAILKETDDVGIYPVRKALAKDIASLQAVPRVDTEGLFLKLSALDGQVEKLRLIPITEKHKLPSLVDQLSPEAAASWTQSVQEGWSQTMEKLSKLVVVQHRDEPVEPLLSPEQTYYLKQNLHLMMQQAQLALLQGEQASFDRSLTKAKEWVDTYFEDKDPVTQGLLQGLNELNGTEVSPALPDISASLKELKSYLSVVHGKKGQGGAA